MAREAVALGALRAGEGLAGVCFGAMIYGKRGLMGMGLMEMLGPLEAILFASGNPIAKEQLAEILQVEQGTIQQLLALEEAQLKERGSGLLLMETAAGWQLATRPEYFPYIEKLAQTIDRRLSAPAMETLAIIAFRQPITKQEIEHIRGVHVEGVLALLIERELVQEVGRKSVLGRPILYGTTDTFLRCFGLRALEELPPLPPVEEGGEGQSDAPAVPEVSDG